MTKRRSVASKRPASRPRSAAAGSPPPGTELRLNPAQARMAMSLIRERQQRVQELQAVQQDLEQIEAALEAQGQMFAQLAGLPVAPGWKYGFRIRRDHILLSCAPAVVPAEADSVPEAAKATEEGPCAETDG